MHELSIAQALAEQIQSITIPEGSLICSVTVSIGSLSGVDPEALEQAYHIATEDLPFKDAHLIIEHVPATVLCHSCSRQSTQSTPLFMCDNCGSLDFEIITGRDMLLKSVEVTT